MIIVLDIVPLDCVGGDSVKEASAEKWSHGSDHAVGHGQAVALKSQAISQNGPSNPKQRQLACELTTQKPALPWAAMNSSVNKQTNRKKC